MPNHVVWFVVLVTSLSPIASALTAEQIVKPASVASDPKPFSVKVEKAADGLLHFTVTHRPAAPRYVVTTTDVLQDRKVILQMVSTAFVREASTTYYVAVAPDRLSETHFQVSESGFRDSTGHPVAEPGTVVFKIDLAEFARDASRPKK